MKKLRAASEHRYEPRKHVSKLTLVAVCLATLGLAGAMYFNHIPLLKLIWR